MLGHHHSNSDEGDGVTEPIQQPHWAHQFQD